LFINWIQITEWTHCSIKSPSYSDIGKLFELSDGTLRGFFWMHSNYQMIMNWYGPEFAFRYNDPFAQRSHELNRLSDSNLLSHNAFVINTL
jgi:hypothetical protein